MALGGGKIEVFRGVDPATVRGEEIRRTKFEAPDGKPAEVVSAEKPGITPEEAKAVLASVGVSPVGVFGRTGVYQAYARAVDAAVAQKLEELKGFLPPKRLAEMEEWIKGTMYDSGKVAFKV